MNGVLHTCSIAHMNQYADYKHKFLITRTCSDNPITILEKYGFHWCPSLSPSQEIFYEYRRLAKLDQWNKDSFNNWYTPAFYNYILNDKEAINMLNYIWSLLKKGEDVVVACYCGDLNMCHRSLVGLKFQELGFNVNYK